MRIVIVWFVKAIAIFALKVVLAIGASLVCFYVGLAVLSYCRWNSPWATVANGITYNGECTKGCRSLNVTFSMNASGQVECKRGVFVGVGLKKWGPSESSTVDPQKALNVVQEPSNRIRIVHENSEWEFFLASGLSNLFHRTSEPLLLGRDISEALVKACSQVFTAECDGSSHCR